MGMLLVEGQARSRSFNLRFIISAARHIWQQLTPSH